MYIANADQGFQAAGGVSEPRHDLYQVPSEEISYPASIDTSLGGAVGAQDVLEMLQTDKGDKAFLVVRMNGAVLSQPG